MLILKVELILFSFWKHQRDLLDCSVRYDILDLLSPLIQEDLDRSVGVGSILCSAVRSEREHRSTIYQSQSFKWRLDGRHDCLESESSI